MANGKKKAKKKKPAKPPKEMLGTGTARGAAEALTKAERERRKFLESI